MVKGELSEDIGGGICQVSSTLFNAVNLQGIQIVERYTHSREVPYVPPWKRCNRELVGAGFCI
ncbi:VanW family protein [Virgibacillus halophilus]|uniref:VanW family protein n=1 Tax=Tigheibacillus halophilus TaxID=361280 RepID=A0ABU5CA49_9BACI|nr:VanW family protein [Virgibacillus halophilus]